MVGLGEGLKARDWGLFELGAYNMACCSSVKY